MRRFLALSLIVILIPTATAQDKLPPRFHTLTKNSPFRLARILGSPEMHPAFNPTTAFSADGKLAVYVEDLTSGGDDKLHLRSRLLVGQIGAGGWPREIDMDGVAVTALALAPDGKTAALGGQTLPDKAKDAQSFLALWDLQTGSAIKKVTAGDKVVLAVALSPDGTNVVAGTPEDLLVWDISKNKTTRIADDKNKTSVTAVAFLPGGKQFLAGNRGGETRLYDIGTEKPVRSFQSKGPHEFVWHLAVSADGKRFASGDFQSSITLWDSAGKENNTLRLEKRVIEEVVTALALAPDGKTVFITWGKANPDADDFACTRLIAWDGQTNKTLWSHIVPYRGRLPILVRDGNLLIGGGPNYFDVWSIKDGKHLSRTGGHTGPINAIAVASKNIVLSAGQEGALLSWQDGKLGDRTSAHTGAITALAVSRDGQQWLTAGADLVIQSGRINAKDRAVIKKAHAGPITSLAFNSDATWAASGSGDRTAKTWDLKTGKEIASFAGHSEAVNAVAISPDDRWLATGSDDATIKLWPIKAGKLDPDRDPITLEKHTKAITCLTFTPDGKRLLSGSQDQKLLVWDWKKGSMDFMILAHKNWLSAILLLDAKTVLTSSDDLSVCAWDLENGMELGRIDFGTVGDCPRCLAKIGPDRFVVGSSSWLIYEFQLMQSKGPKESSK